jgi:hypothetical protein
MPLHLVVHHLIPEPHMQLEALTAQVQDLQQQNERLAMNLNKASAEVRFYLDK